MALDSSSSTEILMLGRTGTGKSTLGNYILQRKAFKTTCDVLSETIEAKYDFTWFQSRVIKVVDTPGLGDNRRDSAADLQQFLVAIRVAIANSPSGYHAILYVIRFGNRYEKKDVKAVRKLKQIFGTEFIRDHCILVLTYGDNFESDPEIKKGNVTFEDWVRRQEEPNFRELVAECGSRVLLFNNRAEDDVRKEEQMAKLLKTTDELSSNGRRYTNSDFQAAECERVRLFTRLQMPYLKEEHIKEIGLITFSLNKIKMVPGDMAKLNQLSKSAGNLLLTIKKIDKGTGQLHVSIKTVSDIISTIPQLIDLINAKQRLEAKKIKYQKFLENHEKEIEDYKKHLKPELINELKKKEEEVNWVKEKLKQIEAEGTRKEEFESLNKKKEKGLVEMNEIEERQKGQEMQIRGSLRELNIMEDKIKKKEIINAHKMLEAQKQAAQMEEMYQHLKNEESKRLGIFACLFDFISKLPIIRSIVSLFKN